MTVFEQSSPSVWSRETKAREEELPHTCVSYSNCDGRAAGFWGVFCSSLYSNLRKTPHMGEKHGSGSDDDELLQPPGHKTGRQAGIGFTGRLLRGGGLMGVIPVKIISELSLTLQLEKAKNPLYDESWLYELCLFSFWAFSLFF